MFPKLFAQKRLLSFFMLMWLTLPILSAQQPGVTLGGFVKFDGILDSRQVASAREGHLLLYPAAKSMSNNEDQNANANLLFAMFQTRLFGKIAAPDAMGAKVSGYFEGDFFGASDATISHYVLRHAWAKMEWKKKEVLIGQTWSPLFGSVFPGTVNFNTGAPMQPFSRNPQIQLALKPSANFKLVGTLMQQRDVFETVGLGRKAQQRAVLPAAVLGFQAKSGDLTLGADVMHKTLRPANLADNISTGAADVYLKLDNKKVTFMAKGAYGGDMSDHLSVGGWVKETVNSAVTYTALNTTTAWVDVQTKKPTSVGLFAGYLVNSGASEDLVSNSTKDFTNARGSNILNVWRVSPRIVHNAGKLRLALEADFTNAEYGSGRDAKGAPTVVSNNANDGAVMNMRLLAAAYVFF
ncbi:MAG TPA: hypothetical protein DIW24_01480 [Bacteroidetes bacterium]|nr:hypothetical protein [Bacteroidota bacterium]HRR07658.1 hypothetical protein [Rhodothermales bacterium]